MPKWEYQTVYIPVASNNTFEELDNYLNNEGKDGWELVGAPHTQFDSDGMMLFCIFKRPII